MNTSNLTQSAMLNRREMLIATASAALAPSIIHAKETPMSPKAFVYTEVAISVLFDQAPWATINDQIKKQPGFLNKTWLHGHGTGSIGGFYAFDSLENAKHFVTGYFPTEPRSFGVAHNTRVFDAQIVKAASEDLGSVHYGASPRQAPGAFVYTELQFSQPFDAFDWQTRNMTLKQVPGIQSKVWLSGVSTNTLGGFDAFDTVEQALDYAINQFPEVAEKLGVAFYTRVFDATTTEDASRQMQSPFYS
ncbi:YdhR family protein [Epibacterium ulvae]|uniref:YdhR family protein n=1 Tax=Epibacterium ulvae TaxID=1156985 RepID=UPI001BFC72F3|nr:YdhR family protein [Epibacterium ulvae]MBT8155390.1 YdhR family protein [Epibacterium ulvae]